MPIKKTQGFFGDDAKFPRTVPQYGCLVMEAQDWIDAINNPGWMRGPKQLAGPKYGNYYFDAMHVFSTRKPAQP